MAIRAHVTIKGNLPGNIFTKEAARIAAEIKVNGWIRACSDGSVETCFEGRRRAVEAMISWCFIGPRLAKVEEVTVRRKYHHGDLYGFRIMTDRSAASQVAEEQYVDSWRSSTAAWRSYS